MDNKELLKVVGGLGFPTMETDEYDFNQVLAEVVKSRNLRLWEGFPVLLRFALDKGDFNLESVKAHLTFDNERPHFWQLLCMSVSLYQEFLLPTKFEFLENHEDLKEETRLWRDAFAHGKDMNVGDTLLSSDKVKRLFQDYYLSVQAQTDMQKRVAKEEVSLEYALSQVFSAKQKELFRKKLDGKLLTKTEREYFSRVVKKKVLALANDELHRLACLLKG
ncbi:hypothetical protein ACFL49_01640 [Candidatus Omnitrophota bacterium]